MHTHTHTPEHPFSDIPNEDALQKEQSLPATCGSQGHWPPYASHTAPLAPAPQSQATSNMKQATMTSHRSTNNV